MSLIIENLVFSYDRNAEKKIIDGLNIEFADHQITAVTGKNGAGKTTLAKLIMGILKPQQGTITLNGCVMNELSLAEHGRKIGYAMQNPARQIFSATVEEEIAYGLTNMGLPEEEIKCRSDEYLTLFGLSEQRDKFPFKLSHGEKQRLVLAAILAMQPSFLILDEPTSGLDLKRRKVLGEMLPKLDCGIIVISHDREFVNRYCDTEVKLENTYD